MYRCLVRELDGSPFWNGNVLCNVGFASILLKTMNTTPVAYYTMQHAGVCVRAHVHESMGVCVRVCIDTTTQTSRLIHVIILLHTHTHIFSLELDLKRVRGNRVVLSSLWVMKIPLALRAAGEAQELIRTHMKADAT